MQPGPAPKNDEPRGSTPVPDPTSLTTQALLTAIDSLKELLRAEIHGSIKLVESRFEANERANKLLQDIVDQQPKILADKIEALRDLHAERFASIQTQFGERDTRVEQTSRDTKVAVDAALMAAEKAVNKQTESFTQSIAKAEAATTKQIDQMGTLIQSTVSSINDKIDDTKDRLTRIEGAALGTRSADTSHNTSTTMIIAVVGVLIALVVGASTLLSRDSPPAAAPAAVHYVPAPVPVPTPTPR